MRLCAETLAGIADPLFPALAQARSAAPAEAARAILGGLVAPLESPLPAVALPPWLLEHQADAVLRARAILDRFGGVLISDGVGLGKTYVGLALAELERRHGGEALVVAPAALRGEWLAAAREVGVRIAFVSHTALARGAAPTAARLSLVVVDEAHAFRNPRTRRYAALADLTLGRRVALLTATPVNNGPADLAALVHLFAGRGAFRAYGVTDIFEALRRDEGADAALALGALTVSRSRRLVESRFPALRGAFPRRTLLPVVRYDLDAAYGGNLAAVLEALGELDATGAAAERGAALLLLGLLRRLASGRTAFLRTLRRHRDFLDEWASARAQGRLLGRRDFRTHTSGAGDGALQLALWPLLLAAPEGAPAAAHPWRETILLALEAATVHDAPPDPKLDALASLLGGALAGRKTIVFTEYRDTALEIARRLRDRHRVLCVVGDSAWAGAERLPRRLALDAFAPRARHRVRDPLLDADLLVATDVASEGMNLQDAAAVVNYDLPWNPVRVMQRVGRIDRLHSPHASVAVAHLLPGRGLHDLTGVLRVLREKLLALPAAASSEPDPLSALWWLDADRPLGAAIERESWRRVEPFEARERWRAHAGAHAAAEPLVAAALVDDSEPPGAGLLLALEWPSGLRIPLPFVLGSDGTCRLDAQALGALAERALDGHPLCARPADFATALAAALPTARGRLVALSGCRAGAPPTGSGRTAALRAFARMARAAARRRDTAILERLVRAGEGLVDELPAGADRALVEACRSADEGALLGAVEGVLARAGSSRRGPGTGGRPRLVFVAALAVASRCPGDVPFAVRACTDGPPAAAQPCAAAP